MTIFYAGIGSRQTPMEVLTQMEMLGSLLGARGFVLRSGRAQGADTAFEVGANRVNAKTEIFLKGHYTSWLEHAAGYHPNWQACDENARMLHARNSAIMLGSHLNEPVAFVVCWTPGGAITGGTGQALRIAANNIPVFNLALAGADVAMWSWIGANVK